MSLKEILVRNSHSIAVIKTSRSLSLSKTCQIQQCARLYFSDLRDRLSGVHRALSVITYIPFHVADYEREHGQPRSLFLPPVRFGLCHIRVDGFRNDPPFGIMPKDTTFLHGYIHYC